MINKAIPPFVLFLFLCFVSACAKIPQPTFLERVEAGETVGTRYYRIKADYSVKDTGEKIEFDYVVVCGATVFGSSHTTSSVEYSYFPHQMIIPTSTGEAVGLRSLLMCAAWTWGIDPRTGQPDGRDPIPDDLMTFSMWYPDVDNLVFAFGYESDLAYESPYARLAFHGASVEQVTHDDWKAWRETSKAEWEAEYGTEPYLGLPGPWGMAYRIYGGDRDVHAELRSRNNKREPAGVRCDQRFALDLVEPGRSRVLDLLPDTQNYWAFKEVLDLASESDREMVFGPSRLSHQDEQVFNGGMFSSHNEQWHELGVRRSGGPLRKSRSGRVNISNGGGRINTSAYGNGNFYHDIYPLLLKQPINIDPATGEPEYVANRLILAEDWNGYSFCTSQNIAVSHQDIQAYVDRSAQSLPLIYRPTPVADAYRRGVANQYALPPADLAGVPLRTFVNSEEIRREPVSVPQRTQYLLGRDGRFYTYSTR